ncbi:hypothetical protein C8Q80DRAFT_1111704 [Daedaleopsis nitida]|nr:hypothetical protein C8Q80DRAFT_1111704 [Daedaleopsis nitida]
MPPRGAPGAPSFDPDKPQSIRDFFEDLDFLLDEAQLSGGLDDEKCIAHAIRYAHSDEKQVWRDLPSAQASTPDYDAFRTAVKAEYLGNNGKQLYSVSDLNAIVRASAGSHLTSASALSAYSRKFRNIGNYLVKHDRILEEERDRLFLSGLPTGLREKVLRRLELKCPDVAYPRKPYPIDDVTAAATHVLDAQNSQGPSVASQQTTSSDHTQASEDSDTKQLTDAIKKLIRLQLSQSNSSTSPARQNPPHFPAARTLDGCIYCSGSHGIRYCPAVDEDIASGLVTRNEQSQVVLRSGRFVPNATAGANLRERVREYYKAHPESSQSSSTSDNPSPAPQLFYNVVDIQPAFLRSNVPGTVAAAEVFAQTARRDEDRKKAAVERAVRAQRRQNRFDEPEETSRLPATQSRIEEVPEGPTISNKIPQEQAETSPRTEETGPIQEASTEHPFASARDATYAPPQKRNFGTSPPKAPVPKKPETAYRAMAPIYDPKHAINVFKRCLEAPVSLSQEELFALAPEIRQAVRESVTSRRLPITEATLLQETSVRTTREPPLPIQPSTPPAGCLVIQDPAEQYMKTLAPGETMPLLLTAPTSAAIRSVKGTFPGAVDAPCTMDTGSAIISMSEDFCHHSGLAYDPDLRLEMQNANGSNSYSLGLARNVPVQFGGLTVYLQIHVLQSPAYDVLLGRPFDLLVESTVQTRRDGSTTVAIHDPNTGKTSVLPTTPRGEPQFTRKIGRTEPPVTADFCNSRI